MSRHIRIKENGTNEDEVDFECYFPHFVFALRDFTLDLEIDGKKITADQYMDNCLTLKPDAKENEQCNLPRRCIRKYFQNRRCFTFDRPCARKNLKNLDNINLSDLSEDFGKDVDKFLAYIHCESPVKKLENGKEINGRMLSSLVGTYVDAIGKGALPCIKNAVVAMATIENGRTVEETLKLYENEMKAKLKLPTPDEKTLVDTHSICLKQALSFFMSKVMCDDDHKFQLEANERIKSRYNNFLEENRAISSAKCRELLKLLNIPIEKKMKNGEYTRSGGFLQYQRDKDGLQKQYREHKDLGIMSVHEMVNFMKEKIREGEGVLAADKAVTEQEKRAEEERKRALDAERSRKEAEREKQRIQASAKKREREMEEDFRRQEREREEEMRRYKREQDEKMERKLAEERRERDERLRHQQQEIDELKNSPRRRRRRKKDCVLQ